MASPQEPKVIPDRHEFDPGDGFPRGIVGPWVHDKHARLRKYVDISSPTRRKYAASQSTFIDLFSGSGRARIDGTNEVVDGSPLVAWKQSVASGAPFSKVFVADGNTNLLDACTHRLRGAGAPVIPVAGDALETVDRLLQQLDPYGLHFAFLDPFNLGSLAFEIIRKLATLQRLDLLLHVSAMDLQMNLRQYISRDHSPLDAFTPGWRDSIDVRSADDNLIRGKFLEYWRSLLKGAGLTTAETHQLVVGSGNQRLYWLAFAAKHELALDFWDKIKRVGPEQLKLI